MFGRSFYHGTIRKYVIVFGNMFNGIQIQRFNSNNERIQTLAVPIAYGPKEKFLVRLGQDPNLDQDIAISLPRIGFEMQALTYASNRKLQSTIKNVKINNDDNKRLSTQFMPVPYDITFLMSIFVKNADDGTQILEQILPYFQPEWTNSIKLMPYKINRMEKFDSKKITKIITLLTNDKNFKNQKSFAKNYLKLNRNLKIILIIKKLINVN